MTTTPFPLGAYVGDPQTDPSMEAQFESDMASFTSLMGTAPSYLDYYVDQSQSVSQWVSNASWQAYAASQSASASGITPVIGLPMTSTADSSISADQYYKNFAAGDYDDMLKGVVEAWAQQGFTTQYWRPGWEMNLPGMPSYAGTDAATQADWIAAYQHIYTVLHAAASADGVNLQVMWNPSIQNYSPTGSPIDTLYPGNQYVDIIGADIYAEVYPYGTTSALYDWDKSGQALNTSKPVYDSSLQQWASDVVNLTHYYTDPAATQWSLDGSLGHSLSLQNLIDFANANGKPVAIAEAGAGSTSDGAGLGDNPVFVQWLYQTLENSGANVKFVNIWDSNGGSNYEFSYASDDKPQEAAAWAKYFGAQGTTTTVAAIAAAGSVSTSASTAASSVTVGAGTDTIALKISEDAWQGDAQFNIMVDGTQIGSTQTAQASHAAGQDQTFNIMGDFGAGAHVVSIDFLDDAYGGTSDTDRNLYVDGASIDGTAIAGASLSLFSAGTQSISATTATTYVEGSGGSVTTLGNDTVIAGSGALTIDAQGPSVSVAGGSGAMTFIAHGGNDTVALGSGAAIFDFTNGESGGSLTIANFTPGTDILHLQGYSGSGVSSETVSGGSTQIVLSDNTSITLTGVTDPYTRSVFG